MINETGGGNAPASKAIHGAPKDKMIHKEQTKEFGIKDFAKEMKPVGETPKSVSEIGKEDWEEIAKA